MKRQHYMLITFLCAICTGCASVPVESTSLVQVEPQTVLSRHYFRVGLVYYDLYEFRKAKRYFKKAIETDEAMADARKYLYRAMWMLDERYSSFDDGPLPNRRLALIEEQRNELEKDYIKGKHLFDEGKYASAKKFFEQCLERIRWFPYPIRSGKKYEVLCKKAIFECERKLSAKSKGNDK